MAAELDEILARISAQELGPAALARLSGVNKGTISRILNGVTKNPAPETIVKLAAGLDLHPQLLLPLEDQIVQAAREAFSEQLRHIGLELRRPPRASDIRAVAGLYVVDGSGERRLFQRVFALPERATA